MNIAVPTPMTVEQFLRWSMEQESGRYELERGRVVAMQAENLRHVTTKRRAFEALSKAIAESGLPLFAMPDGPTVRITADRAYEPDALVAALPMPPPDAFEVPNPIIVVEVLSPSPASIKRDLTTKLQGYALVASISHYLVIDPETPKLVHFCRDGASLVLAQEFTEGSLSLASPGLAMDVLDLFP